MDETIYIIPLIVFGLIILCCVGKYLLAPWLRGVNRRRKYNQLGKNRGGGESVKGGSGRGLDSIHSEDEDLDLELDEEEIDDPKPMIGLNPMNKGSLLGSSGNNNGNNNDNEEDETTLMQTKRVRYSSHELEQLKLLDMAMEDEEMELTPRHKERNSSRMLLMNNTQNYSSNNRLLKGNSGSGSSGSSDISTSTSLEKKDIVNKNRIESSPIAIGTKSISPPSSSNVIITVAPGTNSTSPSTTNAGITTTTTTTNTNTSMAAVQKFAHDVDDDKFKELEKLADETDFQDRNNEEEEEEEEEHISGHKNSRHNKNKNNKNNNMDENNKSDDNEEEAMLKTGKYDDNKNIKERQSQHIHKNADNSNDELESDENQAMLG